MKELSINKDLWLEESLLLQLNEDRFVLGTAPFSFSKTPVRGFYCPGFFLQAPFPWIKPHKLFFLDRKDLLSSLRTSAEKEKQPPSDIKNNCFFHLYESLSSLRQVSFVEFSKIFFQLQQKIKRGDLQKSVPVFFEKLESSPKVSYLLKNLFRSKSFQKREGFLYGFWNRSAGFVGFTPEILFSKNQNRLKVMALAGSSAHPGPNLFLDPKEVKEHEFVVKALRESLKEVFLEKSLSFQEKPFGNLKHLCSVIEGQLQRSVDFESLCRKLHPTPALSGYPVKKALNWLNHDPNQKERSFFATPFGFFDGELNSFCVIAIRGIQWGPSGAFIGSGCGIIEKSVLQKEWLELSLKRTSVKNLFLSQF